MYLLFCFDSMWFCGLLPNFLNSSVALLKATLPLTDFIQPQLSGGLFSSFFSIISSLCLGLAGILKSAKSD
jgi:hypothetical protein